MRVFASALIATALVLAVSAATSSLNVYAETCAAADSHSLACEHAPAARALVKAPSLVQRRVDVRQGRLDAETSSRLRVLCWNVLYTNFGGGKTWQRTQIADIMTNDMQADVAGLQECMNENEMQDALGDRMMKAPGTDTFNCIFYKPGVVTFHDVSGRRYLGDYGSDSYSKRYVSYAKLEWEGKVFWLFSTHWCLNNACAGSNGGLRHKHSAEVILALRQELGAEGFPAIITADANSHMDGHDNDDGVRHLLANGFKIAGKGPMAGGIDYTFVTENDWDLEAHHVGPTAPSDHPSFYVDLSWTSVASGHLLPTQAPTPAPSAPGDNYFHTDGVGAWGGICTCPSGQSYNVGDKLDGCANGPQSLACEGGVPGECVKQVDSARDGMKVICAGAESSPLSPAEQNHYRKVAGVGAWGGTCTCPDGSVFNVGDNNDACASLACEGGAAGECQRQVDLARDGMKVTCAPASTSPEDSVSECAAFESWPHVDGGVTCGSCRALVLTAPYEGRCDRYCESFGHVCIEAAEEIDENCDVKHTVQCSEVISSTSDMLCTCQTASSEEPTVVSPQEPVSECAAFESWPHVDGGVTCGSCRALVLTAPYEGRCDRYCESFGHVCIEAAEEINENCDVLHTVQCSEVISGTSDMLCTCHTAH